MSLRTALGSAAALLATVFLSSPANAQLFRTYIASDGSDANPCTLAAPCRLLPAALAAVADGGEIWMLDSANYNTAQVDITKSVTILAVPGAVGSVVAAAGHAFNINTAGVRVNLRNLVIVLYGGSRGIQFSQGAELNVADCDISGVATAIYAQAPNSAVTVKSSVLRPNVIGFYAAGTVVASLDGVHSHNGSYGVWADTGSRVTVTNGVMSDNLYGFYASATGGSTHLVVERSTTTGNAYGIHLGAFTAGDSVNVTARGNAISHNTTAGVYATQAASTTAAIVLSDNSVTDNAIAFSFAAGSPVMYTLGNNVVRFNTSTLSGGSLTAIGGM